MAVLLTTALLVPMTGYPQTLDDAVSDQLEINPAALNFPCERLLNGNTTELTELVGGLNNICGRTDWTPGSAPANSTGGGRATPITLPSIMQQRLREARSENKKGKAPPKTSGANLDHVAKLGSRLSFFISGEFDSLDRNVTTFEDGYHSSIWLVTANADDQDPNQVWQRSEEKILNISQSSYTGSYTVLTARTDPVISPKPHQVTAEGPVLAWEASPQPNGFMQTFRTGVELWGAGGYEDLDRDATIFEEGYDSDIWRVTVGVDYQFTDRIFAGLAFDYYQQDGNFDGGGGFDIKSLGFIGFGSFLPTDNTFFQFYGGYARNEYDRTRITTFTQYIYSYSGAPNANYDANQYSAGIIGGYDFSIGNVTIGPRIGFDWIHTDFETYSEEGDSGLELTFHDDDQTLLQARAGVRTLISFRTDFGVVVPQASFDWKHEFANDQRTAEVSFVDDTRAQRFTYETGKPDRDWFEINAGVAAALPNGIQLFGNYRTMVGHSFFDSRAGTIMLRYAF